MGAKQSKRSVDISGKEAEGGGEVAAAGAGGEGRVEQLADADALKPQLNGAAHIQDEPTDKEKELDSGTPENEKDATTEKENKEEDEKEKEAAPVTNGETEPKIENGESAPTPEDGKKPKKEKVKKKWSLRSISFSRKDKPKQEKKQKEDEPKTNGEPEKVPEETAEAVPEAAANEEAKATIEEKDEKTPETPVTEPLTNGTSTPESGKAETPASEEAAPGPPAEAAPAPALEPEQLPVNGLSIEEPKPETPEVEKQEETKPEPPAPETAEIVPAPEIPKEVCVEQLPLLEPTPPPLPANPPPSSVASFAATTMAPELTDASLANTADAAIAPLSALPETKDTLVQPESFIDTTITKLPENDIPFVLKENKEDTPSVAVSDPQTQDKILGATEFDAKKVNEAPHLDVKVDIKNIKLEDNITTTVVTETPEIIANTIVAEISEIVTQTLTTETPEPVVEPTVIKTPEPVVETIVTEIPEPITETAAADIPATIISEPMHIETTEKNVPSEIEIVKDEIVTKEKPESVVAVSELIATETISSEEVQQNNETPKQADVESFENETLPEPEPIPESEVDISEADDCSLPPPPLQDEDDAAPALDQADDKVEESLKQIPEPITENEVVDESNHIPNVETNGVHDIGLDAGGDTEALKTKARAALASVACIAGAEPAPAAPRLANGAAAPPAPPHTPQEPLPVSDKLADLIPEVPGVPELTPETLQEAAAN